MTCGSDRTVKLWRPSKLLQLKCYKGHSADVIDCQANRDSSQFLSCSLDKSIILWDVESGKILRRLRNLAPFNSVCYGGPESRSALASSVDGTVRIFDLRALNAWEPVQSLIDANDSVTSCKVYNHLIFTTSLDKSIRVYDLRNGSMTVHTIDIPINHISISANGGTYLVSCVRANALLIDKADATILNEYQGNENKLFKLESTFAMRDTCIAIGSEDRKVYIWDMIDSTPKLALEHLNVPHLVIQSISSDSLDYLLSACGSYMFLWQL